MSFTENRQDFLSCQSGATAVVVGVMFMLIMMVLGVGIDMGRTLAVHNKAQSASDAALLGAVATASTTPVEAEYNALFKANFPTDYMGAELKKAKVKRLSPGRYEATFPFTLPTVIMGLFDIDNTKSNILSQVTRGYMMAPERELELALVLDNSDSMGGVNLEQLKLASKDLVDIIFGTSDTPDNVHISLVPYSQSVNVGPGREGWVQADFQWRYRHFVDDVGVGVISNRNNDHPHDMKNDVSDATPTTEDTRFRLPCDDTLLPCKRVFADLLPDPFAKRLAPIGFALNNKVELYRKIGAMQRVRTTRLNVGLMWGWFTLSPNWQGQWDAGKSDFPQDREKPGLRKAMVFMTDGENTVFTGGGSDSVDDDTTAALCSAIKAQGITIYVIGLGGVDEDVLRPCATGSYYWPAPTAEDLRTAFKTIGDIIDTSDDSLLYLSK